MPLFEEQYLRGLFPAEIDENKMSALAGALSHALGGKLWVVGRDARASSQPLMTVLTKGLSRAGLEVIDLGLASASQVAYAVLHFKAGAGALVTGGDAPEEYNGLKLWGKDGAPVGRANGLTEVERLLQQGVTNLPRQPGVIRKEDIFPEYLANLLKFADDLASLSIVADTRNGVMGDFLPDTFERLPCELIPLSDKQGRVASGSEEDSFHRLELLGQRVRETSADLGVTFDADGDRCRFVDNNGEPVAVESVGALLAGGILQREPGAFIAGGLLLNKTMFDEIDHRGGEWTAGPEGHCRFSRFLREKDVVFGCTPEGRYYFRDIHYLDNPEMAVIQLAAVLSRERKSLAELTAPLNHYLSPDERKLTVPDSEDARKRLAEHYRAQEQKVLDIDGISMYSFDCWFNARSCDPKHLSIFAGAMNSERLEKLFAEMNQILSDR